MGCQPLAIHRRKPTVGRNTIGLDDKIGNAAEKLGGKGQEATGEATDDESLKAEGQCDQAKGDVKQAGEKIKDVFKKDKGCGPHGPHPLLLFGGGDCRAGD